MKFRLLSFLFLSSIVNSYCTDTSDFNKALFLNKSISMDDYLNFLNNGGDINYDFYASPLYHATSHRQIDVVELLIMRGADIDLPVPVIKSTPLLEACFHGDLEIVRLLLHHKADPNKINFYKITPLKMAVLRNHIEVAKLLIQHNATIRRDEINIDISPEMRLLLEYCWKSKGK